MIYWYRRNWLESQQTSTLHINISPTLTSFSLCCLYLQVFPTYSKTLQPSVMSSQRFSVASDAPPPYTEGRAPPSYTNGEDATTPSGCEARADLHTQQAHHISALAPAALNVSTRVRHIAPPVRTPHNAFVTSSNRTPFKYPTRPGRGYTSTAVSHTYIDMPETNLTTQPVQYSQTNVSTTASRTIRRWRIVRSWSFWNYIAFLLFVVFFASVIYLAVTTAKKDSANAEANATSANTEGYLNYG
jgi:hypothetical protein